MHPFSVVTLAIFVAGYGTARWDLVTRLYELALFAWDKGVISRSFQGFALLSLLFLVVLVPVQYLASLEADLAEYLSGCWDMPEHDGLMRVFWPADIERSELPGVIVGWKNSSLDVVVVAVLNHVDPKSVESALERGILLRNAPHPTQRIAQLCGSQSMHVLGLTNVGPDASLDAEPSWVKAKIDPYQRAPTITCAVASSVQIILFERPIPQNMQYISLNPIALALVDKEDTRQPTVSEASDAEEEEQEKLAKKKRQHLVEKLQQHSVIRHPPTMKDKVLPRIVNQVNWAWELEQLLQKNVSLIGTRPKRTLSVSERVVEQATTMRNYVVVQIWDFIILYIFPIIRAIFIFVLIGHRGAAEILLQILEWRPRPGSPALKDISATAQQVEIRLQQFCYWPMQYVKLRLRKNDWDSVTTSHPDYIRFYNSLWLVANDVIIGIALGSYIIDNAAWVSDQIGLLLQQYTVDALHSSIEWLMGWPAGLKLNKELALFLGDLFLWVIEYWAGCIRALQPVLPRIIWFIGFSSFGGASMPIAFSSDLLSLLTVHIYSFYLAAARIFHWQLTILLSLFQLFRGKKYNVLRNRVDSCDYDLDQLLLGTILFTLLFFLLPTVAVFYLNFAVARMAIILLKAMFDTQLSCLNHFPLFAPDASGEGSSASPCSAAYFRYTSQVLTLALCKPIPLSFTAMFHQYFRMGKRIRKHYLSPRVVFCLATGRFVPPINRRNLYSLQYSMLPAARAGIMEMWHALNSLPAMKRPVKVHPFVSNGGSTRMNGRRGAY
ncbi:N-acetylglucosaminyl-phosphatidylinositol biosynthetic protein [Apiospora phragmitis]|uniref:N-acetylglucosaminyl-phosphatidylinositol biosynthetic protein n=1 Tax=Apiospora phragmitis TaxID=2905665 RepID=A0ABR1TUE9_9PEZI